MGEIIDFKLPPRVDKLVYKLIPYHITYLPDDRSWEWRIQLADNIVIRSECKSFVDAMIAAKLHINLSKGVR